MEGDSAGDILFQVNYADMGLTASATLRNNDQRPVMTVSLNGMIGTHTSFITRVMMECLQGTSFDMLFIDAGRFIFIDGGEVNNYAVECIVTMARFAMGRSHRTMLIIDDDAMRGVLTEILGRTKGFSRIAIHQAMDFTVA